MPNTAIQIRAEQLNLFPAGNQKSLEFHKKTASHLEAAGRYHLEAVKYQENGDYGKATQSKIIAKEHLRLASEALKDEIYQHELYNEFEI